MSSNPSSDPSSQKTKHPNSKAENGTENKQKFPKNNLKLKLSISESNQKSDSLSLENKIITIERDELDKIIFAFSIKLAKLKVDTKILIEETKRNIVILGRHSRLFLEKHAPTFIESTKDYLATSKSSATSTKESISPEKSVTSQQKKTYISPSTFAKLISIMKSIPFFGKSFKPGSTMSSPSRPMKYPYTHSAKIAQFPYKFYINNNWMYRYYGLALLVTLPVFYKLSRASNTPENVKKWEEIRKKDFGLIPHDHH